ncbi:hypothetical protein BGZ80_003247 [Entomortierella chlamydospora]|uniref:Uncharacterized protein n=1 Tax=Entomortierella chlamydospora TaxID=101097 RepID=A0A9P6T2U1_9FUNG|nr:hypothetical protein BGZ80_003247 [Entomortierella chlamydospora]
MVLAAELPLPDECVDLIVAYLVDDRQALHALILSSQKLFQRTAPILYRSPFRFIEHSRRWSKDEKERRSTALLALLLTSTEGFTSPESPPHPAVLVRQDHDHNPQPTTLDYLRFFIYQNHVDLFRPLVNLRAMDSIRDVFILDQSKSMADLQIDVAASLIHYRAEDIKVIGLPIARVPLILVPRIQRLKNLVRLELTEIPYDCKIEPILEFIRVHDFMHKSLREIKIKGRDDLNRNLERNHTQLVRLVQAMRTPQVVDARNWREAILVLHQIPYECLRTLLLGMADMPPSNIPVADYLEQCVYLEELRMPVRDEKLFAWAIDRGGNVLAPRPLRPMPSMTAIASASLETLAMPITMGSPAIAATSPPLLNPPWHLRHHSHSEWDDIEDRQGIARIKSLELSGEDGCLIPVLRDAVDAFRDSLEILKAQSLATMMTTDPIHNSLTLTWSWMLSRLTVLDLEGEVASAFDFSALKSCPVLTTLRLALPPYMYSSSEDEGKLEGMKAKMSKICLATKLLDLELRYKWPVSDELLALIATKMRQLTNLYIVQCRGYSLKGVRILIERLERLQSLSIDKWMCSHQSMQGQLLDLKSLNPRLDIVEL